MDKANNNNKNKNKVLELKDISKTYRFRLKKNPVLEKVNLMVNQGEFVFIQGKSGSGKTTLLNIISGIIKPSSGKVVLVKKELHKFLDPTLSYHRGKVLGFVFQSFNLINYQSVLENVMTPLKFHAESGINHRKLAIESLESVELGDKINYYPNLLSGGQMQRVAIARALIKKPKLIIADEPTGNLDKETSLEIARIFKKLNEEKNITFIVVSHDDSFVKYSDKRYILENKNLIEVN